MDYSIQLEEEPRMVMVTISGVWEYSVDTAMGLEVMEKMLEWKADKALIDMRDLQFELRVLDLYERAETLRKQRRMVGQRSSKVALVYHPESKKKNDDFTFFENTARNRGLPYRVFKNIEAALEWLAE